MERSQRIIDDDVSRADDEPATRPVTSTPALSMRVWQARIGDAPCESRLVEVEPARLSHVPCDNPDCRGGGLDLRPLLRELIDAGGAELRVIACEGRFKGKGPGRGARCDTMFCVSLASSDRST